MVSVLKDWTVVCEKAIWALYRVPKLEYSQLLPDTELTDI